MYKLAMILCVTSVSLTAQWPDRLAPGIPRTPGGQPNLSAPAPRSADGKPDLSGVWLVNNSSSLFYVAGDLKPEEMLPWAAALYKQREADFRKDSDGVHCLPPGPKAGISVGPFPMKILQTPGLVAVLYEYQTIFRQLFTDGRALPKDPNPTWMGYSVAHWEGETLVATTAGYNDKTALDLAGHPHTEALRLTERYRRRDVGHMDLQVTFDDPKDYTRPWTLLLEYELIPDGDLIEYVCENERDTPHLVGKSGDEVNVSAGRSCPNTPAVSPNARIPRSSGLLGREPSHNRHRKCKDSARRALGKQLHHGRNRSGFRSGCQRRRQRHDPALDGRRPRLRSEEVTFAGGNRDLKWYTGWFIGFLSASARSATRPIHSSRPCTLSA